MRPVLEIARELLNRIRGSNRSWSADVEEIIAPMLLSVIADATIAAREETRQEMLADAVRDCPGASTVDWARKALASDSDKMFRRTEVRELLGAIDWLEARIAFLANETDFADEIAAAEKRGYRRAIEEKMAAHPTLHKLWGKAKDHADYDKAEWMALQSQVELAKGGQCRHAYTHDDAAGYPRCSACGEMMP